MRVKPQCTKAEVQAVIMETERTFIDLPVVATCVFLSQMDQKLCNWIHDVKCLVLEDELSPLRLNLVLAIDVNTVNSINI